MELEFDVKRLVRLDYPAFQGADIVIVDGFLETPAYYYLEET